MKLRGLEKLWEESKTQHFTNHSTARLLSPV